MWLFKQHLSNPAKTAVKLLVTLSISSNVYLESTLKLCSPTLRFLLERFVTDDNITRLYVEIGRLRRGLMTRVGIEKEKNYAQRR